MAAATGHPANSPSEAVVAGLHIIVIAEHFATVNNHALRKTIQSDVKRGVTRHFPVGIGCGTVFLFYTEQG